ncbi:MAG: tRNA (adenosine(37)-N6)-threonylcarbamoyltransferase complex ATPase subunit type 1 TsaE, partial [bacterium]|nr:tRNA (adenosine(37)-N6)-threonylcarbamoyltransferase complex ATPase subunit type 1 TsaE [bacterium]
RRLTSPTFVLMKKYNNLYHLDCYRIKNSQDVLAMDFKEIISNPKNIVLIEWAEKIKRILPKNKIWIKFKILGKTQRLVTFS